MTLAAQQAAFMDQILAEDHPLPGKWRGKRRDAGLSVYRNAYRSRLVEVVLGTFPRTQLWVGEGAMRRAAAHHLIQSPPTSWTIDLAGKGFDLVLEELFSADPEIGELAWLEWAIHKAFVAANAEVLTQPQFGEASQQFSEADWTDLRLTFLPSLKMRQVRHDVPALYRVLDGQSALPDFAPRLPQEQWCLCWREQFTPTFRLVDRTSGDALQAMLAGATFGEVCAQMLETFPEDQAVAMAGQSLALWLGLGIVTGVKTA